MGTAQPGDRLTTRPRGGAETPEEVADRIEGCRLLAASMRQGASNAVAEA